MKLYTLCHCVALPLGTYSTKWCLALKKMYSLYSLRMFPHRLSVASMAPLRTRKGCMQLIISHVEKDHDDETNAWSGDIVSGTKKKAKIANSVNFPKSFFQTIYIFKFYMT